ncbi:MAG: chloride channel protein [Vulcanimicrobiota bacterium]
MLDFRNRAPWASGPDPDFRLLLISALAAVIGIVAGSVAFLLLKLIAVLTNLFFYHKVSGVLPSFETNPLGLWLPLVPAAGGLVVGYIARFVPQIRGHGIPEAMEAVSVGKSRIAPKVAVWKPLSAALAIGSGGPFGAEGPIIQTGGAVGSLVGQVLTTTASERKVLLACGAAAGMAATFSTPIAAVIVAIELLLFEFKSRSFIPLVVASTLATNVHLLLFGRGPLFEVGETSFGLPEQLPFYLGLGILSGLLAVFITRSLYWIEDGFERLPFDPMWWPALGGLILGVIGWFVPRVLGVGYQTITDILNDNLTVGLLLAIMVGKLAAMLITLGSGTSGGLLAPTFMGSAAMGSLYATGMNHLFPWLHLSPGAYALAAMAAVFGAASRSTFAFFVFAFEITRNYNAVLPLMLTSVIADGVALVYLRNSIMTEKLARRGLRISHDYEPDVWRHAKVEEMMDEEVEVLLAETPLRQTLGHPLWERQSLAPVVDEHRKLVAVLSRGDVLRALANPSNLDLPVAEIGSRQLFVAFPHESIRDVMRRILERDVGCFPVVTASAPDRLLGLLERRNLVTAYRTKLHDDLKRDAGWLERVTT